MEALCDVFQIMPLMWLQDDVLTCTMQEGRLLSGSLHVVQFGVLPFDCAIFDHCFIKPKQINFLFLIQVVIKR